MLPYTPLAPDPVSVTMPAQFVQELKGMLEQPASLFVE